MYLRGYGDGSLEFKGLTFEVVAILVAVSQSFLVTAGFPLPDVGGQNLILQGCPFVLLTSWQELIRVFLL